MIETQRITLVRIRTFFLLSLSDVFFTKSFLTLGDIEYNPLINFFTNKGFSLLEAKMFLLIPPACSFYWLCRKDIKLANKILSVVNSIMFGLILLEFWGYLVIFGGI